MNTQRPSHPHGILHAVFTAHLPGGEWPDEMHVDVVAHERSRFAMQSNADAKMLREREPARRWPGRVAVSGVMVAAVAVNVPDAKGRDVLTTMRVASPMPLGKRLSYAAARVDEMADKPMSGKRLAAALRPGRFAVASLTAKVEKAGVIATRRKLARAA